MKNRTFFGTLILEGFWKDFKRAWGAQILDFRSFFDVISKQYLKRVSMQLGESKNLEKSDLKGG